MNNNRIWKTTRQIHLWTGLTSGAVIVVVCLSGVVLALLRPIDALVASYRAKYNWSISRITIPESTDEAVSINYFDRPTRNIFISINSLSSIKKSALRC